MKKQRNVNLLLMLVLLVAVGQMAQTIYIPAIAVMAKELNVREGAVQSVMAAYLLTYGVSQLFYGPLSDRVGRRPVILVGMSIFMVATVIAITTPSLTVLIAASALQGVGTGVGGVMARTLPRDMYQGTQLRHANSLLNMGILVSPLLAPLIGGLLDTMWSWRACYAFLLVLCIIVTFILSKEVQRVWYSFSQAVNVGVNARQRQILAVSRHQVNSNACCATGYSQQVGVCWIGRTVKLDGCACYGCRAVGQHD